MKLVINNRRKTGKYTLEKPMDPRTNQKEN